MSLSIETETTRKITYTVDADELQEAIKLHLLHKFRHALNNAGQRHFLNDIKNFDAASAQLGAVARKVIEGDIGDNNKGSVVKITLRFVVVESE